jgi:hypothetical protein
MLLSLWITYYIILKAKGYIFSQRQVPEKWTHKFKSLLIKPIIIRAQRGYINHGTFIQISHIHTHTYVHTYILIHILHWLFWLDTAQWKHIIRLFRIISIPSKFCYFRPQITWFRWTNRHWTSGVNVHNKNSNRYVPFLTFDPQLNFF